MGTEILRCAYVPQKHGAPLAQCARPADWQCVRCGLGYCHGHQIWHRSRQAAEAAPDGDAAAAQVMLARRQQGQI